MTDAGAGSQPVFLGCYALTYFSPFPARGQISSTQKATKLSALLALGLAQSSGFGFRLGQHPSTIFPAGVQE